MTASTPTAPTPKPFALPGDRWSQAKIYTSFISCGVHQLHLGSYHQEKNGRQRGGDWKNVCMATLKKVCPPGGYFPRAYILGSSDTIAVTCAFYVFSDADVFGNGLGFSKYIRDNNLGELTESVEKATNPNSGHDIRVWVWRIDRPAVKKHLFDQMGWDEKGFVKMNIVQQTANEVLKSFADLGVAVAQAEAPTDMTATEVLRRNAA